jgi:hypothetical protein
MCRWNLTSESLDGLQRRWRGNGACAAWEKLGASTHRGFMNRDDAPLNQDIHAAILADTGTWRGYGYNSCVQHAHITQHCVFHSLERIAHTAMQATPLQHAQNIC